MSICTVENLSHGFGDRGIFEDVSFRLLKGEHVGLIGANGEGKSTFFSVLTGKIVPDEGKVTWSSKVRVGYLDQQTVLEKGTTIRQTLQKAPNLKLSAAKRDRFPFRFVRDRIDSVIEV